MMKHLLSIFLATGLAGCVVPPHVVVGNNLNFSDTTVSQPNMQFQETTESKSIIVGSQVHATLAGCSYMQRYKVVTNADFLSTLNLFKYRAAKLGAERVVIVHHSEVDGSEFGLLKDTREIIIREGTTLEGARYFSTVIGDIYDCPCSYDTCSAKLPAPTK